MFLFNILINKNQFNNYLYKIFIYFAIFSIIFFNNIIYIKKNKTKQSFIIALRKLIKKARKSLTFL